MKVGIRVDASARMGTGHLRRCLSLARALDVRGAQVRFVTRDLGIDSSAMIAEQGFDDIVILPAPDGNELNDAAIPHAGWVQVSVERDSAETVGALANFQPDWVVVDSYGFDSRWHDAVREGLGARIAQIDDVADRTLAPDLLIDHNHAGDHAAKYAGSLARKAKILGGPRYALLGPRFAEAQRYEFNEGVGSVGVFMGGIDAGGHSATVLAALRDMGFDGPVEIVTTAANPNLASLRDTVTTDGNAQLSLDLPDLAEFFARHDIQVGAGGGASWERCCIGVPTLLVIVAENQRAVAPQLAAEGIVALADGPERTTLAAALEELIENPATRRSLASRSRQLVDGLGATRVALKMLAHTLAVRPATIDDARRMFDWRNDESTRAVSVQSDELQWDDHVAWLERVLADPARKLFVGEIGGQPVGIIRFDFSGPERAEVSLYLDPAMHGIGLGPHLLLAGESAAGAGIVDATVLESNRPSQRLFEICGYHQTASNAWVKQRG